MTEQWFWRAFHLSSKIQSELSVFEELTLEKWRKSSRIPVQLLNYSKFSHYARITFSLSTILYVLYRPDNPKTLLIPIVFGGIYLLIDLYRTADNTINNQLPMLKFYS